MNIQRAAEVSGLTRDAIRFYEKKGILPRPPRLTNGYRTYTEEHLATLRLARGLRQLGVPLADVRPILDVAHTGECGDIRGQLLTTLGGVVSNIDAQIADLQVTRDRTSQLMTGLAAMHADEFSIPGAEACPCIGMVTESR